MKTAVGRMHQYSRWTMLAAMAMLVAVLSTMIGNAERAAAQSSAASVSPAAGAPSTTFTFSAFGFQGDQSSSDDEKNHAEKIAYWITTPEGKVISTRFEENDNGDYELLETRALRDGSARWSWTAPAGLAHGTYTLTAEGEKSGYQVMVSFVIDNNTISTAASKTGYVSPERARPGKTFRFSGNGFKPDTNDDDNNDAEKVAYWINTPDGRIISRDPAKGDDDEPQSYLGRASEEGVFAWEWTAPADAVPGTYVMVAHGLDSNLEVTIPFEVSGR